MATKRPSSSKKSPRDKGSQGPGESGALLSQTLDELMSGGLLGKIPDNPLMSILKELGLEAFKGLVKELGSQALRALILRSISSVHWLPPSVDETHYGPRHKVRNGKPGETLYLKLRAMIDVDVYSLVLTSEAKDFLVKLKIPRPGALAGMPVEWSDLTELMKHGTVGFTPKSKTTDKNGYAMLQFKPRNEEHPGRGPEGQSQVKVSARVRCDSMPLGRLGPVQLEVPSRTLSVNYHPGYLVNHSSGSVTLQGEKLAGAVGNWELQTQGTLSGEGMQVKLSGRFTFELDESLGGEMNFELKAEPQGLPEGITAALSFTGKGLVQLEPSSEESQKAKLWMTISQIDTNASGAGHFDPWVALDKSFSSGASEVLTIPVEVLSA